MGILWRERDGMRNREMARAAEMNQTTRWLFEFLVERKISCIIWELEEGMIFGYVLCHMYLYF